MNGSYRYMIIGTIQVTFGRVKIRKIGQTSHSFCIYLTERCIFNKKLRLSFTEKRSPQLNHYGVKKGVFLATSCQLSATSYFMT